MSGFINRHGTPGRKFPSVLLLLLLAFVAWAPRISPSPEELQPAGLTLFFMGERQSQIEPCGCIQKKLGGVQFESALYATAPRPSSLRLDAGGFSSRLEHPEDSMRTRFALQAMAGDLDLDAINVSARDLTLGNVWFGDVMEHFDGVAERLVSANILGSGDGADPSRFFQPWRVVERSTPEGATVRVLITGITTSKGYGNPSGLDSALDAAGWTLLPAAEALREALREAPPHDLAIVMAATDRETAADLVKDFPELDVVITSAKPARADEPAAKGPVLLHLPGSEGKLLGRANLAPAPDGGWTVTPAESLEVSPDLEPAPRLVELIESYKSATAEMMVLKPRRTERVFAGARACGTCHVAEYEDWRGTRHARALDTLVAKGMQFDSRCLQCHTVGFGRDNGFYNVRESMTMAGVQCESCHGPAAEHAELEQYLDNRRRFGDRPDDFEEKQRRAAEVVPSRAVASALCVTCHTPENDDHFVYEEKVLRVNHARYAETTAPDTEPDAPPPD